MANKNILTYGSGVQQIEQDYYSPVATITGTNQLVGTLYCFISKVLPWGDEENPEYPQQDQKYLKGVYKNIFIVKKINANDIHPVIQRQDWKTGTVYDYYQDDINMFRKDQYGYNVYNFYVRNRYDQVFKCLWNNNRAESIYEPFIQPGSYDTNNIYKGGDGYKWKYMYTIDMGSKFRFMDSEWMPIHLSDVVPNPVQTTAGCGDIEVINVVTGGQGYDPVNSTITVVVTGDGTGANGSVTVANGAITDVIVANTGINYTYANVSIVSSNTQLGNGATVIAPISPIGGHSFDPISELGCNRIMYSVEFDGSENNYIPTDIDYRQIGLILNPMVQSADGPVTANAAIYKAYTSFVVASGFGSYTPDEIIYQGTTLENASFTATVLNFDSGSNIINLINITGSPTLNAPVFGNSSSTVRTLLSVSEPSFITLSGYITYIENRASVQRSADGIEQFKFVLAY